MTQLLNWKALLLSLMFLFSFTSTINAQNSDGFINDYKEYREVSSEGFNIGTQPFGTDVSGGFVISTQIFGYDTPLDGGLLILALTGAAYAFKKRKNNNKK